jgi:hypothetical protein
LNQERFVHILDGLLGLTHADGQCAQTNRPPAELLAEIGKYRTIDFVEPQTIDAEQGQTVVCGCGIDGAVAAHLGEISDSAKKSVGDTRRAPSAPRDFTGTLLVEGNTKDASGAHHDELEFIGVVVIQSGHEPKAIAKRAGDQPGARRGTHKSESGKIEPN